MTKADLVDQVTALGDLTRRDGEVIVDTLFESIISALKSNDKVEVRGFGSFRTRQRNSRTGRNPKTGAAVAVPAKRVPFFKPSKELRDLVNPSEAAARTQKGGHDSNPSGEPKGDGNVDPHHPPPM
jgi:integration host factor subunit beta